MLLACGASIGTMNWLERGSSSLPLFDNRDEKRQHTLVLQQVRLVDKIGHRHQDFARALEWIASMGHHHIVEQNNIAGLPLEAHRHLLIEGTDLSDNLILQN